MDILENFMLLILNYCFYISKNYGLAIILLTVIMKFVLYPLTFQSSKQMAALQRIQPILSGIQKKYKEEPKKLQEEMLNLYKRERVSPFGGCLPILLQIPVFIALFLALKSEKFTSAVASAGGAGKFLWIGDLTAPDKTLILIILIVITTYIMQKTMPSSQQNQMITLVMPLFIGFISYPFPSGLQIYWVVSNIVTAAQQLYIFRKLGIPITLSWRPI